MLVPLKTLYYTDLNVLSTIFQTDSEVDNNYDDDDNEYEDDDLVENYLLHQDTVFELLEPSTFFVGLQSPPNAIDPFSLPKLFQKVLQKKKTWRINLVILLWQVKCMPKLYIYKNLLREKKTLKYQKSKKYQLILIHPYEIFVTKISVNKDLSLSSEEYHSVY